MTWLSHSSLILQAERSSIYMHLCTSLLSSSTILCRPQQGLHSSSDLLHFAQHSLLLRKCIYKARKLPTYTVTRPTRSAWPAALDSSEPFSTFQLG